MSEVMNLLRRRVRSMGDSIHIPVPEDPDANDVERSGQLAESTSFSSISPPISPLGPADTAASPPPSPSRSFASRKSVGSPAAPATPKTKKTRRFLYSLLNLRPKTAKRGSPAAPASPRSARMRSLSSNRGAVSPAAPPPPSVREWSPARERRGEEEGPPPPQVVGRRTRSANPPRSAATRRHDERREAEEEVWGMPAPADAAWLVANVRRTVPEEADWWPSLDGPEHRHGGAREKEVVFHNPGLHAWHRCRRAWVRARSGRSPPGTFGSTLAIDEISDRRGMAVGLSTVTRTYQLPGRMSLPDVIMILNKVWEEED